MPFHIINADFICSYGETTSTTPPKQPDHQPRPLTTARQATHPQPVLLLRLPPTCRTIITHTIRRWLNSLWLITISLTKLLPRLDLQAQDLELGLGSPALGPAPVLVQVLGPEQQQTRRLKDIWDLMANGSTRLNRPRRQLRGRGRRSSGPREGESGRIRRCWSGTLVSIVLWFFLVFSSFYPCPHCHCRNNAGLTPLFALDITAWFRLFVGDLSNDVNDNTLNNAFAKYPSYCKCKVVRDRLSMKVSLGVSSFLPRSSTSSCVVSFRLGRPDTAS